MGFSHLNNTTFCSKFLFLTKNLETSKKHSIFAPEFLTKDPACT